MRLTRSASKAAVLGCGPAGLFAAHALIQRGWDVTVFSKKRKSTMYGAQYLHAPIPGLTPEDAEPIKVQYLLEGSVADYQTKVYGSMPVKTSVELLSSTHQAWDIRQAYDAAWDAYGERVVHRVIGPEWMADGELDRFRHVVSSVPLIAICGMLDVHQFHTTNIWAIGDAPDRGQYAPFRPPADTVLCDGTRDRGWYRASNIFGHVTVEWPGNRKPPLPGIAPVGKPVYSTCDCYARRRWNFAKVGRYGTWSKGVLSHQAYWTAADL